MGFYYDFWPLKAVMSNFLDLKCEGEFLKIKDLYFQHLGVIRFAKTSLILNGIKKLFLMLNYTDRGLIF